MTYEAYRETYKGLTVTIEADEYPEDPCVFWDLFGTMACCHPRYDIGHKQLSNEEIEEIANDPANIVLPVFLYDHSGLTISTKGFSCPWDSGQIGIVYVSKKRVREEFNVKRISSKLYKRVVEALNATVETYDDYLTGNVWSYIITDQNEEVLDSCCGFYGDWNGSNGCLASAQESAQYIVKKRIAIHCSKVKQWIKARVPFQYRAPCPVQ